MLPAQDILRYVRKFHWVSNVNYYSFIDKLQLYRIHSPGMKFWAGDWNINLSPIDLNQWRICLYNAKMLLIYQSTCITILKHIPYTFMLTCIIKVRQNVIGVLEWNISLEKINHLWYISLGHTVWLVLLLRYAYCRCFEVQRARASDWTVPLHIFLHLVTGPAWLVVILG